MATTNTNEYYKVSFITTNSKNIPNLLAHTGGLIVMTDLTMKDPDTNKNAMSLWLHGNCIASGFGFAYTRDAASGQWLVDSYNKILGGESAYVASDFLPNKDEKEFNPETNKNGQPHSVISRIWKAQYDANLYTDNKYTELNGQISELGEDINNKIGNINTSIKTNQDSIKNAYSYACTGIALAYAYTNYWVYRILGGAPDFIDSLQEIAFYLENDRDNAMQTLGKLSELQNNAMLHNQPTTRYEAPNEDVIVRDSDSNKILYTYLAETSYKEVIDKNDESTKREGTTTYITYATYKDIEGNEHPTTYIGDDGQEHYKWDKITYSYTYYVPKKIATGMNAATDKQICCTEFNQHNLTEMLRCIVNPYPYEKPSITIDNIDNVPTKQWQDNVIEYGTQAFSIVNAAINLHDAENITKIQFDSELTQILSNSQTIDIANYITNKVLAPNLSNKSDVINLLRNPYQTILTSYTLDYGKAIPQVYPQLVSLNDDTLKDTTHTFEEGTLSSTLTEPLKKKIGIKVFYGTGDNPDSENIMLEGKSVWIDDRGAFDMQINNSNDVRNVWFAVPSMLFDDTSVIVLKSDFSNITTVFANNVNNSDILTLTTSKNDEGNTLEIEHNTLKYKIISIANVEFRLADDSITASIKW